MKYLVLILLLGNSLIFAWIKNTTQPRLQPAEIANNIFDGLASADCQSTRNQPAKNMSSLACWSSGETGIHINIQWHNSFQATQIVFYRYNFGGGDFHGYPTEYQRDTEYHHPEQDELIEITTMQWQAGRWIIYVSTSNIAQNADDTKPIPLMPTMQEIAEFIYEYLLNAGELTFYR